MNNYSGPGSLKEKEIKPAKPTDDNQGTIGLQKAKLKLEISQDKKAHMSAINNSNVFNFSYGANHGSNSKRGCKVTTVNNSYGYNVAIKRMITMYTYKMRKGGSESMGETI
jgi:hypothetical protein